jgi:putative Mn2+ efflux pump MntP
MTVWQKIFIGVFSVLIWVLALIVHHLWIDIDTTAMETLCQAVLVGLGVTHLTGGQPVPVDPAQVLLSKVMETTK